MATFCHKWEEISSLTALWASPEVLTTAYAPIPLWGFLRSPPEDVPMDVVPVDGMENREPIRHAQRHRAAVNRNHLEVAMCEEPIQVGFPRLMTETELVHFLRIPDVSQAANPRHVVENLKRFHQLPCIHISRQPLYPLAAVRKWKRNS